MLQERFKINTLLVTEESDEKDLEKERKEEEKKEEEANLGDPGTEDFPGEHHLSGEHSFGRRDAWKFISNSKKQSSCSRLEPNYDHSITTINVRIIIDVCIGYA